MFYSFVAIVRIIRKILKKVLTSKRRCDNICLVVKESDKISASGSVVEHLLAKERVAGSSPVSRSFYCSFLFNMKRSTTLATPSSSLDSVI